MAPKHEYNVTVGEIAPDESSHYVTVTSDGLEAHLTANIYHGEVRFRGHENLLYSDITFAVDGQKYRAHTLNGAPPAGTTSGLRVKSTADSRAANGTVTRRVAAALRAVEENYKTPERVAAAELRVAEYVIERRQSELAKAIVARDAAAARLAALTA